MKKLLVGVLLSAMYLLAGEGTDPSGMIIMVGSTMLSTNNYLTYYGFISGTYTYKSELVTKIAFAPRKEFGAIEGDKTIDTPEEFITAAYFSPIKIEDASALAAIEKELPHSDPATAGLKLGAMWYQK